MNRGPFAAAALVCYLLGAAPAAAQAVSLTSSHATVQPGASSPVLINQAFGSNGWSATGSSGGTTYTGNSVQIPGVNPARWFCYIRVDSTRAWSLRTRTADFGSPNCPTNGLGAVTGTTGLVHAVIVEDGPPPSVVAQFRFDGTYWSTSLGYLRSATQSALTTTDLTNINARTAERVLVVHNASGGTLCITGSETGCTTALTWIPNAAAATSMTLSQAFTTGFRAQWSGAWSGSVDNTLYLFAKAVPSGLTVDVSSGAVNGGGSSHSFSSLTANTRYVVTVCSRLATGGAGELCYDASADSGVQGVAVTTLMTPVRPTSVTVSGATSSGFNVAWSGAVSGISDGSFRLFVEEVASGLDVDVSSGATTATGASHAVTGLTAGTRYVVTVCSTPGTFCYDASADTGVQGVAVTTLAPGAPGAPPAEPAEPPPPINRAPQVVAAPGAVALEVSGTAAIALSGAFLDPDYHTLTLSATSSRPHVATVGLNGSTLVVAAVAEGQTRITVLAADPEGATASLSFLVTVGNPVFIGGDAAGPGTVVFSAPEGGVAEIPIVMAEPREQDVSFTYSLGPDGDAATADADDADHGGEGGTVTIPAGETEATIRIPILDDDDIEPAREAFAVTLTPMDGAGVAVSSAIVHVAEGVCDRSWQVADALRGGRDCEAVTPAELMRRRTVRLPDAGLAELHPLDFLGLAGLTVLILDGNGLSALPEGLLAGSPKLRVLGLRGNRFETLPALGNAMELIELDLADNLLAELPAQALATMPALGYLYLGGNRIEALPADLLAEGAAMRILELQDNALAALPAGLFAGAPKLFSLQLQGNPGAPFALPVELASVAAQAESETGNREAGDGEDAEDRGARAEIQLSVPHGAPFAISAGISAAGATLSAQAATIAAGETLGSAVSVVRDAAGNETDATVTVEIGSVTSLPTTICGDFYDEYRCFRGFELRPGGPLTLFEPQAAAAVPTMR